jgi:hypothetical protein
MPLRLQPLVEFEATQDHQIDRAVVRTNNDYRVYGQLDLLQPLQVVVRPSAPQRAQLCCASGQLHQRPMQQVQ